MNGKINPASELSDEELMAIAYGKESEPTENKNSLPSLSDEDLYQKVGINPYDWEKPKSMSWMQAFLNAVRQGEGQAGLNSPAVRNFSSGLGSGAYENVRGAAGLFGKEIPNQDFGGQPGFSRSLGELVGKYGPQLYMAGKATRLLPASMQSSILPQSGILGLLGGALEPGSYGEKAQKVLTDAALGASTMGLVKGAKQASASMGSFLDKILPNRYEKKLGNSLSGLTGGKNASIASENKHIYDTINKNYRNNLKQSEDLYNKTTGLALSKGYEDSKYISTDGLNKSARKDIKDMDEIIFDKKSEEALKVFLKKPNFDNAHKLQSILGERASSLGHNNQYKNLASRIRGLRDKVKENIENSFKKYGDDDLVESYKKASDFYRDKVAPYWETEALKNIAYSKPEEKFYRYPNNPINALGDNESQIAKVVNDLDENAYQALLARMLEKTNKNYAYGDLEKVYKDILTGKKRMLVRDKDLTAIEGLLDQGKKLKFLRDYLKKYGKGTAAGTLGLGAWKSFKSSQESKKPSE